MLRLRADLNMAGYRWMAQSPLGVNETQLKMDVYKGLQNSNSTTKTETLSPRMRCI
ncbi:hypothetical protein T4B_3950 [Trichinella pseudospiralis]|uniref:Uncharacterized protein n=1 Tax=Trichinella pseudospiralis TaxID=6337 RepID=A0A0V1GCT4_TRIPS|nr:hypothetical protein T4B_3950 [Trichinella pseudospiralis]